MEERTCNSLFDMTLWTGSCGLGSGRPSLSPLLLDALCFLQRDSCFQTMTGWWSEETSIGRNEAGSSPGALLGRWNIKAIE